MPRLPTVTLVEEYRNLYWYSMSPLSESNWDHKNAPDSENPDIEAFSPIRNKVKWPNWDRKTESYPSRQQNSFNILLKRYCLHNYYQCSLMKVTESEKNACKNTRERERKRERAMQGQPIDCVKT